MLETEKTKQNFIPKNGILQEKFLIVAEMTKLVPEFLKALHTFLEGRILTYSSKKRIF